MAEIVPMDKQHFQEIVRRAAYRLAVPENAEKVNAWADETELAAFGVFRIRNTGDSGPEVCHCPLDAVGLNQDVLSNRQMNRFIGTYDSLMQEATGAGLGIAVISYG